MLPGIRAGKQYIHNSRQGCNTLTRLTLTLSNVTGFSPIKNDLLDYVYDKEKKINKGIPNKAGAQPSS